MPRGSRSPRSRPAPDARPRRSSRSCPAPANSSAPSCGRTSPTRPEATPMPRATPSQPDEEELMARYLAEAGDPHVEPPPEHVARLRSLLLDRLAPSSPRPGRRWAARVLVGSGLAAAAVVLAMMMLSRPVIAWAQ